MMTPLNSPPSGSATCTSSSARASISARGSGLGALSVGAAAAVGAVCPMCVVAVPALISSGLWSRHKSRKAREEAGLDPAQPHDRAPEPA